MTSEIDIEYVAIPVLPVRGTSSPAPGSKYNDETPGDSWIGQVSEAVARKNTKIIEKRKNLD